MFPHEFSFDPTYGFSRDALLAIEAPLDVPTDFAAFWRDTFDENAALPLNICRCSDVAPGAGWKSEIVTFDTLHGMRIGAWLLAPEKVEKVRRGFVAGHGYGGRNAPRWPLPFDDAVYIFPCAPGFDLSAAQGIPDNAAQHVIFGIESRETYLLRACVASLWSAASALMELHPEIGGHVFYWGESFGGGLGALMLPWDKRFQRALLKVPTFGHHPLRLQCPCVGSGEAVRELHAQRPEIIEVLRYYDAATSATHIAAPTLCMPALFDPAVPPPGQFAVNNALRASEFGSRHETYVLSAGHFTFPGTEAELRLAEERFKTWFSATEY